MLSGIFLRQIFIFNQFTQHAQPMEKKKMIALNTLCYGTRKFRLCLLAAFVLITSLHAQMQYNQWAFGWHASYDFTASGPLPTAPLITSQQDAASWCDNTGNLMFYTDGQSIYNVTTPANSCTNCLNGNPNGGGGTQGVLILPRIGGPANEFYIFTVSDKSALGPDINNGLSYYVYNTTTGALSGVTSMGTTPGTSGSFTTEGLTAIPHTNGTDYWIIVKAIIFPVGTPGAFIGSLPPANQPAGATNTSIYAYKVTSAGVSSDPVVSDGNYGPNIITASNFVNEIKCSPNRQLVSITDRITADTGNTMLYRFNSSNGKFAFLHAMPMLAGHAPFGASFSPNSNALYVCGHHNNVPPASPGGTEVLRQYDLTNIYCSPFIAPPFCDFVSPVPFNSPAFRSTQLQLTPKGTIFRVRNNSLTIDVITTPNNIGCANIGYLANAISIGNAPGEICKQGLPNNIDALAGPVMTSEWPKTTTNTITVDNGVAIDVDQNGDVYSAGTFKQSTQFETVTITGGGTNSAYLAKYDDCNGLKWVARGVPTTSTGFVNCHSMDVAGNMLNRVFFTGSFRGTSTFYQGVSPSGPLLCAGPSVTITGSGIYIAVYNLTGCLLGVTVIPDDANFIHNSAHINVGRIFNTFTGYYEDRIYMAINETDLNTTGIRIRVYAFVLSGPATLNSAWIVPLRGTPSSQVSDIHSDGNRIAITGTYDRDIFWNTETTAFASTPTGVFEAFVATMNDVNGFSIPMKVAAFTRGFEPTSAGTSQSSGSGVQCVGSSVLLTGTYTGATTSVFNSGMAMSGNGAVSCAYAVNLHTSSAVEWAHTFSCDGTTFGHDVTRSAGFVYFTGTWTNDTVFNIDNMAMPADVPMKNHMYVVKMYANGDFTAPGTWQNHSYMNSDVTELMKPARIAANATWVYVNGSYKGTGQMEDDIAFNSPLTSTVGTFNSFVWRYGMVSGTSFREGAEADETETEMESTSLALNIFPNPAQTTLTIQISAPEENTTIEVYNAAGQLMINRTTSTSQEQVDVSQWAPGIYFVRIESGGEVRTEKFIRNE